MEIIHKHLFALLCGFIGGIIPNNKSNIYPPLLGAIFAILFTKIVYGDYDKGYQWTQYDILFILVVGGIGFLGGWVSRYFMNLFLSESA